MHQLLITSNNVFLLDMATSGDNDARIALFQSIGLNEQKARETLKNQEVTRLLETTINEVGQKIFILLL